VVELVVSPDLPDLKKIPEYVAREWRLRGGQCQELHSFRDREERTHTKEYSS
jgi:hypothetical protein